MEKPGLIDTLILPLKWLERSRGWKRRGLILLYLVVLSVGGVLAWRELQLWRLPDLREPFDEARYSRVAVADSDNALPLYREALALIQPADPEIDRLPSSAWNMTAWSQIDPLIRAWAESNRPALDPWLRASDRPDFLAFQPDEPEVPMAWMLRNAICKLARFGLIEGARRFESGDVEGAWIHYRGVLRSSRHVGLHAPSVARWTGNAILVQSKPFVEQWIDSPLTTPAMLRRAIRDVEDSRAMTPPHSDMVRAEYFQNRAVLDQPGLWKQYGLEKFDDEAYWYLHFPGVAAGLRFLRNEPRRSHRVHRLITAGVLAQCDRPPWARAKLALPHYQIYDIGEQTPPALRSITPESLQRWADHSAFAGLCPPFGLAMSRLDGERGIFDNFRLRMAERAYEIEKGKPSKLYGDLLGSYLRDLPDGIEPGDPLNPSAAN